MKLLNICSKLMKKKQTCKNNCCKHMKKKQTYLRAKDHLPLYANISAFFSISLLAFVVYLLVTHEWNNYPTDNWFMSLMFIFAVGALAGISHSYCLYKAKDDCIIIDTLGLEYSLTVSFLWWKVEHNYIPWEQIEYYAVWTKIHRGGMDKMLTLKLWNERSARILNIDILEVLMLEIPSLMKAHGMYRLKKVPAYQS